MAWYLPLTAANMLAANPTSTAAHGYARRRPETTVLYGVVRDHLQTLLDHARDRSEHGFGYPRFVEREFEKFLVATGERGYQIHRRHRYPGTHPVARGRFFALTVLRRHAHELTFAERTEQSRA